MIWSSSILPSTRTLWQALAPRIIDTKAPHTSFISSARAVHEVLVHAHAEQHAQRFLVAHLYLRWMKVC